MLRGICGGHGSKPSISCPPLCLAEDWRWYTRKLSSRCVGDTTAPMSCRTSSTGGLGDYYTEASVFFVFELQALSCIATTHWLLSYDDLYKSSLTIKHYQHYKQDYLNYFKNNCSEGSHNYHTRFSSNNILNYPTISVSKMIASSFFRGIFIWNTTPSHIFAMNRLYQLLGFTSRDLVEMLK